MRPSHIFLRPLALLLIFALIVDRSFAGGAASPAPAVMPCAAFFSSQTLGARLAEAYPDRALSARLWRAQAPTHQEAHRKLDPFFQAYFGIPTPLRFIRYVFGPLYESRHFLMRFRVQEWVAGHGVPARAGELSAIARRLYAAAFIMGFGGGILLASRAPLESGLLQTALALAGGGLFSLLLIAPGLALRNMARDAAVGLSRILFNDFSYNPLVADQGDPDNEPSKISPTGRRLLAAIEKIDPDLRRFLVQHKISKPALNLRLRTGQARITFWNDIAQITGFSAVYFQTGEHDIRLAVKNVDFPERLRLLALDRGWTIEYVLSAAGLNGSYFGAIRRGQQPSAYGVTRLIKVLNAAPGHEPISESFLLAGVEPDEFARWVRTLRNALKISPPDMADRLGVTPEVFERIEDGQAPSFKALCAFASASLNLMPLWNIYQEAHRSENPEPNDDEIIFTPRETGRQRSADANVLGEKIAQAIRASGLSVRKFAALHGLSDDMVSDLIQRGETLSGANWKAVAAATQHSVSYFLTDYEDPLVGQKSVDFWERLQLLRIEGGFRQNEFEAVAGINRSGLNRLRSKGRYPDQAMIEKLRSAINHAAGYERVTDCSLLTGVRAEEFGAWLKELRRNLFLFPDELAQFLRIPPAILLAIERGEEPPSIEVQRAFMARSRFFLFRWGHQSDFSLQNAAGAALFEKVFLNGVDFERIEKLSDADLACKTDELQGRFQSGEPFDAVAAEALVVFRVASERQIGQIPSREQTLGACSLVARMPAGVEQPSGQGKSLTLAMAAYVLFITRGSVHVHTWNSALVQRDGRTLGQILSALNVPFSILLDQQRGKILRAAATGSPGDWENANRAICYRAGIVYGPYWEFIFDALQDDLLRAGRRRQPAGGPGALLVDEADIPLLDEATSPLLIVQPMLIQISEAFYRDFYEFATQLTEGEDYQVDRLQRSIVLSPRGVEQVRAFARQRFNGGLSILIDLLKETPEQYAQEALLVREFYRNKVDYLIHDDQVKFLDPITDRIRDNVVWEGQINNMIAAKERLEGTHPHVKFTPMQMVKHMITPQSYYRRYADRLGVVSATLAEDADELEKVYGIHLTIMPPTWTGARLDRPVRGYITAEDKMRATVHIIKTMNAEGNPVVSVQSNGANAEALARALKGAVPLNLLDPLGEKREAAIVGAAGQEGAVTVSSKMIGRGTDIRLQGKSGYLTVTGEPLVSRRHSRQLRSRAGRWIDPGQSFLLVSLDDDLIQRFAPDEAAELGRKFLDAPEGRLPDREAAALVDLAQQRAESQAKAQRAETHRFGELLSAQANRFFAARDAASLSQELWDIVNHHWRDHLTVLGALRRKGVDYVLAAERNFEQMMNNLDSIYQRHPHERSPAAEAA